MKLRRQKRKKDHALDAVASITKTWSEWQLAKRAGQGVAKAKEIRPSKIKSALNSKRLKLAGALAVAGGAAAVVARKLKGGEPPESYAGPAPSDAVEAIFIEVQPFATAFATCAGLDFFRRGRGSAIAVI